MGLRYLFTLEDFEYEGENIPIRVHHRDESGSNPLYRIELHYKNCNVIDWYYHDDKEDAYSLARIYCSIIDKYGQEGIKQFKECKEKISEIKRNYILIDSKVFKFKKTAIDVYPNKMYSMHIIMTDGTRLNGDSFMNHDFYIKDKDCFSYSKTLENLRFKTENYFKMNKVLPCDEYFLEDKTKEYSELLLNYQELLN